MATIRERTWRTSAGEERTAWIADFFDAQGVRRQKTFKRKKDADVWLVQARGQIAAGTFTPESTSITLGEACERWIQRAESRGKERGTVQGYRQHVAHIKKLMPASMKLARITKPMCEQLADRLLEAHSARLAPKILQSFRSVLHNAQRQGLVAQNVAVDVKIEGNGRGKRKLRAGVDLPTGDEFDRLLAAAADPKASDRKVARTLGVSDKTVGSVRSDPNAEIPQTDHLPLERAKALAMVCLAGLCGLRISEIRGLAWTNVHLTGEHPVVHVVERADKWSRIGNPKSEDSHRTIPLGKTTVSALRAWKLAQAPGRTLVFGTASDRADLLGNLTNRLLKPLEDKAGVPRYGWHGMRHYRISTWLQAGLDPAHVAELAGHSDVSLTLRVYSHFIPRGDDHRRVTAAEMLA